jgi:hypothetical protein
VVWAAGIYITSEASAGCTKEVGQRPRPHPLRQIGNGSWVLQPSSKEIRCSTEVGKRNTQTTKVSIPVLKGQASVEVKPKRTTMASAAPGWWPSEKVVVTRPLVWQPHSTRHTLEYGSSRLASTR